MFDALRIRLDFSRAAAGYERAADLQRRVLLRLVEKAAPLLTSSLLILDAGCGTGRLAPLLPAHRVVALDLAYDMCVHASPTQAAVNGNIERLPFPDAAFEAVFSSLALQWLDDPEAGMKELRRVLKPEGILAVSALGPRTLHELAHSFAAADPFPHVSSFAPIPPDAESEIITEHFADLTALMRRLKETGARNKRSDRRRSLFTPRQLRDVERRYQDQFATSGGLPVTWEISYLVERHS